MHNKIPDFTDTELWVIRQAVSERFRKEVDIQQADAELRLDPGDRELTLCPVVYRCEDKAQFVIFKTGAQTYHNQFFYSVREQYGTGRDEYTDIGECVNDAAAGAGQPRDQERPEPGNELIFPLTLRHFHSRETQPWPPARRNL
jgi:hypothetical protein